MKINSWQIAFDAVNGGTETIIKVNKHNTDYEIRIKRNKYGCLAIIYAPTISKAFHINPNWPYFNPDSTGFKLLINMILGNLV